MTKLLTYVDDLDLARHCDAHCYNATSKRCKCICSGLNHGVGYQKAVANTRDLPDDWTPAFPEANSPNSFHVNLAKLLPEPALQLDFWPEDPDHLPPAA